MIKELIVAIALGALLGFGITGGYFAVKKNTPQSAANNPSPTLSAQISQAPTQTNSKNGEEQNLSTNSHTISVESPENFFLSPSARITIKGATSPESLVIITTGASIYNSKSDSAGNFAIDIDLESGANLIKIESISTYDEQTNVEMTITYSTAKI